MKTGIYLTAALAGLALSLPVAAGAKATTKAKADTCHCKGANSCSGNGHACAGQGFADISANDCKAKHLTCVKSENLKKSKPTVKKHN